LAVFIDTSLFIAIVFVDDENHWRAIQLMDELSLGRYGRPLITSDIVFVETVGLFHKKLGGPGKNLRAASKVQKLYKLIEERRLEMLYLEEKSFGECLTLYSQRQGKLDFVDSANVVLMRSKGVAKIASFDSNYDAFKKEGIERVR